MGGALDLLKKLQADRGRTAPGQHLRRHVQVNHDNPSVKNDELRLRHERYTIKGAPSTVTPTAQRPLGPRKLYEGVTVDSSTSLATTTPAAPTRSQPRGGTWVRV